MDNYFEYSYIIEKKPRNNHNSLCIEKKLVDLLIDRNITISTAESITGGLVGGRITNISGSSNIYEEGYITYSDRIKNKILGIENKILEKHTAVSIETCKEMLMKLKELTETKALIVTTGNAGPGELEGLAYLGINYNNNYRIIKFESNLSRNKFRNRVVELAFVELYFLIKNN